MKIKIQKSVNFLLSKKAINLVVLLSTHPNVSNKDLSKIYKAAVS